MKSENKFILWLSVGIISLIGLTFWIIQNIGEVTYINENTPEAVTHDYILALHEEDYGKAYTFISQNLENYPNTLGEFLQEMTNYRWRRENIDSFLMEDVTITGTEAIVIVSVVEYYQGDIFSSGQTFFEDIFLLREESGVWKIYQSSIYLPCFWNTDGLCR